MTGQIIEGKHGRRYRIYKYRGYRLEVKARGRWRKQPFVFETESLASAHIEELERSHRSTDLLLESQERFNADVLRRIQNRNAWLSEFTCGKFPKGMGT